MTTFQWLPSSELDGVFGIGGNKVIFTQCNCISLLNLDDTIKYYAIYKEVIHYCYRQFYFFFPLFITSMFSSFCKTILMRTHFTKHEVEKANKSASKPYILK